MDPKRQVPLSAGEMPWHPFWPLLVSAAVPSTRRRRRRWWYSTGGDGGPRCCLGGEGAFYAWPQRAGSSGPLPGSNQERGVFLEAFSHWLMGWAALPPGAASPGLPPNIWGKPRLHINSFGSRGLPAFQALTQPQRSPQRSTRGGALLSWPGFWCQQSQWHPWPLAGEVHNALLCGFPQAPRVNLIGRRTHPACWA